MSVSIVNLRGLERGKEKKNWIAIYDGRFAPPQFIVIYMAPDSATKIKSRARYVI